IAVEAGAGRDRRDNGRGADVLVAFPVCRRACLRCRSVRALAGFLAAAGSASRGDDGSQRGGGFNWKAARPLEWKTGELRVASMIAPQVTRLARSHRHHVKSRSAKKSGEMRGHPVQTRVVASADFGKHERGEVAIGA